MKCFNISLLNVCAPMRTQCIPSSPHLHAARPGTSNRRLSSVVPASERTWDSCLSSTLSKTFSKHRYHLSFTRLRCSHLLSLSYFSEKWAWQEEIVDQRRGASAWARTHVSNLLCLGIGADFSREQGPLMHRSLISFTASPHLRASCPRLPQGMQSLYFLQSQIGSHLQKNPESIFLILNQLLTGFRFITMSCFHSSGQALPCSVWHNTHIQWRTQCVAGSPMTGSEPGRVPKLKNVILPHLCHQIKGATISNKTRGMVRPQGDQLNSIGTESQLHYLLNYVTLSELANLCASLPPLPHLKWGQHCFLPKCYEDQLSNPVLGTGFRHYLGDGYCVSSTGKSLGHRAVLLYRRHYTHYPQSHGVTNRKGDTWAKSSLK